LVYRLPFIHNWQKIEESHFIFSEWTVESGMIGKFLLWLQERSKRYTKTIILPLIPGLLSDLISLVAVLIWL
jgi:hypothetical protein